MTLKKLAEQILLRYKGSRPTADTDLDEREIYDLIIKTINAQIKLEQFNVNLPQSERFVPNAGLATYVVDVASDTGLIFTEKVCARFGKLGSTAFPWATTGNDPWQTEDGDNWTVDGFGGATISIADEQTYYDVLITGLALPKSRTAQELENFIKAGTSNSVLTFVGTEPTTPSTFAIIGMQDIAVSNSTISFKYFVNLANTVDEELIPVIGPTTDLLKTEVYNEFITDFERCDYGVVDTRGRAKITLPAQPIALPRGMGIWHIGDYRDVDSAYIPIQAGEHAILKGVSHTGLNSALGRLVAYEWYGNSTVYFNKTAGQMPEKVLVRLVVVDPETLGEYDLLPIPADMEEAVVVRVLEILKADGQPDVKTDKLP
jgi:hypothetical protein